MPEESGGGDAIHSLWLDLRAAAGAMSLWGQVAAAEIPAGEVAERILSASERLIIVIEQLEEATGWSEQPEPPEAEIPARPRQADVESTVGVGSAHCALRRILGSTAARELCGTPDRAQGPAALRVRLQDALAVPVLELAVPQRGKVVGGGLVLDVEGHSLEVGGTRVHVPESEFRALLVLMANPGCVVRPEDLGRAAWGHPVTPKQSGDVIHALRRRLAAAGAREAIRTMRPQGYQFLPSGPAAALPPQSRTE